jgi:hypothetical protein
MVLGLSGVDHHHHHAENAEEDENQEDEAATAPDLRSFLLFFLHVLSPSGFLDEPQGVSAFKSTWQRILRATLKHCQPEIPQASSCLQPEKEVDTKTASF